MTPGLGNNGVGDAATPMLVRSSAVMPVVVGALASSPGISPLSATALHNELCKSVETTSGHSNAEGLSCSLLTHVRYLDRRLGSDNLTV